jgi:hypothetical protein
LAHQTIFWNRLAQTGRSLKHVLKFLAMAKRKEIQMLRMATTTKLTPEEAIKATSDEIDAT